MSNKEIILYQDNNIKELKTNISNMQEKIIDLTEQKLEIERNIYSFNNQYNEIVGPHLLKYLKQKEENISIAIEQTDDANKKQELEDKLKITKDDMSDFKTHQDKNTLNLPTLTLEQEAELKTLYKKACRLCHPDMVDENFKEEALSLFHRLNEANQKKDISKVKEILEYLQDNNFSISSDISDVEILKKRHSTLKSDVLKLELEIQDLKNDDTYKKISKIQDWNRYFKIISKQLEKEVYKQEV